MLRPVFVRHERMYIRINPENVICLQTEGNYTKIFLDNNAVYMVRSTLTNALNVLPSGMFVKISRSLAVSVFFIDKISKDHLVLAGQGAAIASSYYDSLINSLDIIE